MNYFFDIPSSYSKIRKKKKIKVGENNGQLRFRPSPRVAHASTPGPKYQRAWCGSGGMCFFCDYKAFLEGP